MRACRVMGGVGGLTVALGVGAAVFGGAAVAWADSGTGGGEVTAERTATETPPTAGASTARSVRAGHAYPHAAAVRAGLTPPVPRREAKARLESRPVPRAGFERPVASRRPVANAVAPVAAAAATQPVILGPSGVPIPPNWYVAKVMQYYMPTDALPPTVVFTPEGLYPITGTKSLPLSISANQGLTILSDTLNLLPTGTATTMFGYSQSAIIGSLMQSGFNSTPVPDTVKDSINFTFVGNEMNPNGGFLSRFPGLNLPSLGIPFYGATPENAYPTTNYTLEYDGFGDFPRYPLNILADINAALGIIYVHTKYTPKPGCTSFCTTLQQVQDAIPLPSTSPTERYFFMPTRNLPLVQPLRRIRIIGTPIADLVQPVLKVIVDLGYGDPAHGFPNAVQPIANVQVPFGLFPEVKASEVIGRLVAGIKQGLHEFIADFGPNGSIAREIAAITKPSLSVGASGNVIPKLQTAISNFSTWLSTAVGALYTPLLPTADILNAIFVSLPAYDAELILNGIQQMIHGEPLKGLVNMLGLPIAADVGLVTTATFVELLVWGASAKALVPAE